MVNIDGIGGTEAILGSEAHDVMDYHKIVPVIESSTDTGGAGKYLLNPVE